MINVDKVLNLFSLPVPNPFLNSNYNISSSDISVAKKLTNSPSYDLNHLKDLVKTKSNTKKYLSLILNHYFDFPFSLNIDSKAKRVDIICFSSKSAFILNSKGVDKLINNNVPFGYRFGVVVERAELKRFSINVFVGCYVRVYDG